MDFGNVAFFGLRLACVTCIGASLIVVEFTIRRKRLLLRLHEYFFRFFFVAARALEQQTLRLEGTVGQ